MPCVWCAWKLIKPQTLAQSALMQNSSTSDISFTVCQKAIQHNDVRANDLMSLLRDTGSITGQSHIALHAPPGLPKVVPRGSDMKSFATLAEVWCDSRSPVAVMRHPIFSPVQFGISRSSASSGLDRQAQSSTPIGQKGPSFCMRAIQHFEVKCKQLTREARRELTDPLSSQCPNLNL